MASAKKCWLDMNDSVGRNVDERKSTEPTLRRLANLKVFDSLGFLDFQDLDVLDGSRLLRDILLHLRLRRFDRSSSDVVEFLDDLDFGNRRTWLRPNRGMGWEHMVAVTLDIKRRG